MQVHAMNLRQADTGGIVSLRKLQFPLDRLEARLVTYGVKEWGHLHLLQIRRAQMHRGIK